MNAGCPTRPRSPPNPFGSHPPVAPGTHSHGSPKPAPPPSRCSVLARGEREPGARRAKRWAVKPLHLIPPPLLAVSFESDPRSHQQVPLMRRSPACNSPEPLPILPHRPSHSGIYIPLHHQAYRHRAKAVRKIGLHYNDNEISIAPLRLAKNQTQTNKHYYADNDDDEKVR